MKFLVAYEADKGRDRMRGRTFILCKRWPSDKDVERIEEEIKKANSYSECIVTNIVLLTEDN